MQSNIRRCFHFDINGTIIGIDSTDKDASIEDAALEAICRATSTLPNQSFYEELKAKGGDYKSRMNTVFDKYPERRLAYEKLVVAYRANILFPSFQAVVKSLGPNDRIILRTFGLDGPRVVELLDQQFGLKFQKLSWNSKEDSPSGKAFPQLVGSSHILIQDNYNHWNTNGRQANAGKMIPRSEGVIQIGFDDNPCMYAENPTSEEHERQSPIIIHRVVTERAALDENYYLNLIAESC